MCGNDLSQVYLRGGCDLGSSGVQELYFANFSGSSVWTQDAEGKITGATDNPTFYRYMMKEETGEFKQGILNSRLGNASIEQLTTMVFIKNRQEVVNRVSDLITGTRIAIVKDENGQYFLTGRIRGLSVNGGEASLGVSSSDDNTASVILRTIEPTLAPEIDINGTFANTLLVTS